LISLEYIHDIYAAVDLNMLHFVVIVAAAVLYAVVLFVTVAAVRLVVL